MADPQIAWGKKVDGPFKVKVLKFSAELGCDPSHLTATMAFETRETFSPNVKNPNSSATGLSQARQGLGNALGG